MDAVPQLDRQRSVSWVDPMETARIGRGLTGKEFLSGMIEGRYPPPPIAVLLGFGPVSVEEGRVVFSMVPAEYHYNPIGVVHGGVAATLLDSVMGCAVHSTLGIGRGYTTLEFKINFVRGLTQASGRVEAEGRVLHAGRQVATAEGKLIDARGRVYAHATTTCLIFDLPKA